MYQVPYFEKIPTNSEQRYHHFSGVLSTLNPSYYSPAQLTEIWTPPLLSGAAYVNLFVYKIYLYTEVLIYVKLDLLIMIRLFCFRKGDES